MKAILIEDSIKLPTGALRSEFPKKAGLYLVDDGTMYSLVVVDDTMEEEYPPFGFAIPRESVIKEYERIGEREIDLLQKQLAELNKGIKDNHEFVTGKIDEVDEAVVTAMDDFQAELLQRIVEAIGVPKEQLGTSEINIKDLTEMIAVAQKPELLKK